jgi:hypothetical protein
LGAWHGLLDRTVDKGFLYGNGDEVMKIVMFVDGIKIVENT